MSREDVLRRFMNWQQTRNERRSKLPEDARKALGSVRLENAADSADYTLWISDEIGGWWGITAQDFAYSIRQIPRDASITVMLDSPGGSIFEAIPIYNLLKQHQGHVTVDIYGLAASAASFIAMAGDTVKIARNGRMMIHDGQGEVYAYGDEAVMRDHVQDVLDVADLLSSVSNTIADMYMQRAGGTVAEWRARMRATTWYDSSEALNAGLVDEIDGGAPGTPGNDSTNKLDNELDLELFSLIGSQISEVKATHAPVLVDLSGLRDALKGVFQ